METLPSNFLGLEAKHTDYESARFAVLPVPYEATTYYQSGTRHGPRAILTASEHLEFFDEELEAEFHACGIHTLEPLAPDMSGPAAMHERVLEASRRIVHDGKFPLVLGGEHGISSGVIRAVAGKHEKLSVLQIDAHPDLHDRYDGTPYSHASVMRRALEYAGTLVPVGIRAVSREETQFMQQAGIQPITARCCLETGTWIERALDALGDTVYVTVDIDGFDPAYAPGTGTPEPGGLDWYQVISLLRAVAARKRIVGADIVEVMPVPGQAVTEFLAARLAYKLICYAVASQQGTL